MATNKACSRCAESKPVAEFNRDRTKKDGLCSCCRVCNSVNGKRHYIANPKKYVAAAEAWRVANIERAREIGRATMSRWRARNKPAKAAWAKANAHRHRHYAAQRRMAARRQCPPWADVDSIAQMYEVAQVLSRSGAAFEVDHIVPLISPAVCGLHVVDNLRVVPRHENRSKHNRQWPDQA